MVHSLAKASCSSFFDIRRGPCVPGSSSLKQARNTRPLGLRTVARPATYFFRSSSLKTWNRPLSITLSNRSDQSLRVMASLTRNVADDTLVCGLELGTPDGFFEIVDARDL